MDKNLHARPDDRAPEQNAKPSKIFREAAEEYRAGLKRDGVSPKAAARAKRAKPTPELIAHEQRWAFVFDEASEIQRHAMAALCHLSAGDLETAGICWGTISNIMKTMRPTYAALRAEDRFLREQESAATVQEGGNA